MATIRATLDIPLQLSSVEALHLAELWCFGAGQHGSHADRAARLVWAHQEQLWRRLRVGPRECRQKRLAIFQALRRDEEYALRLQAAQAAAAHTLEDSSTDDEHDLRGLSVGRG